jgi:hypothetical protein
MPIHFYGSAFTPVKQQKSTFLSFQRVLYQKTGEREFSPVFPLARRRSTPPAT